jgi:uncharacterized protein YkwD
MIYLKKAILFFFIIPFLLFTSTSCSDEPSLNLGELNTMEADLKMALEIHQRINAFRVSEQLVPFIFNEEVSDLAINYSKEMHITTKQGSDFMASLSVEVKELVNAEAIAENFDADYYTADSLVEAWLTDKNFLSKIVENFTHTGIAAVKNQEGSYIFIQVLYR